MKIQSLEKQQQTNDIVNEIIEYSIEERVLSFYTAFLCLEPSRGGEVCYDCMDESDLVSGLFVTDDADNDSIANVYPNPFNNQTRIEINLSKLDTRNLSFNIFNITGKVVKTFKNNTNTSETVQFIWDGTNNSGATLSSGTYFFVANYGKSKIVRKLLLLK